MTDADLLSRLESELYPDPDVIERELLGEVPPTPEELIAIMIAGWEQELSRQG